MANQDVINFDTARIALEQERADDVLLNTVFERQLRVSLLVEAMAETLYRARSLWIGGETLAWSDLTVGQKRLYRTEVERLVTTAKGEQ